MSEVDSTVEWRSIPGFQAYRISSTGIVQKKKKTGEWKALRQSVSKGGYLLVSLSDGKKRSCIKCHILVLRSFVGPCPVGMETRHFDGNPKNNCLENLKWGTKKENGADTVRLGRSRRCGHKGVKRIFKPKLTKEQVLAIRKMAESGAKNIVLAKRFGCLERNISRIVNRWTWVDVWPLDENLLDKST